MFDRIDPALRPYIDSEARQLLQGGQLRTEDHQALLDEAKKKHDFVEASIPKPTLDDLRRNAHPGDSLPRLEAGDAQVRDALERDWYERHRAEAIRKGNETGWRDLPSAPEPPRSAVKASRKGIARGVWAEIKKHPGIYLLAFLLSGLPVGFATIWPTLTHKTAPEWLAEHGWPRLTTLVEGWVAIAFIIATVIVWRSYLAARHRALSSDTFDLAIKIQQVYVDAVCIFPEDDKIGFDITIQLSLLNTLETPKFIDAEECTLRVVTSKAEYLGKRISCKNTVYQEKKKMPMEKTMDAYELERRQYTKDTPGIDRWIRFRVDSLRLGDLEEGSAKFSAVEVLEIELTVKDILGHTCQITEHPPWITKGILLPPW